MTVKRRWLRQACNQILLFSTRSTPDRCPNVPPSLDKKLQKDEDVSSIKDPSSCLRKPCPCQVDIPAPWRQNVYPPWRKSSLTCRQERQRHTRLCSKSSPPSPGCPHLLLLLPPPSRTNPRSAPSTRLLPPSSTETDQKAWGSSTPAKPTSASVHASSWTNKPKSSGQCPI